jgi:hypothetical protein
MLTPRRFAESSSPPMCFRERDHAAAFLVPVRDPGGVLSTEYEPKLEAAARPLTQPPRSPWRRAARPSKRIAMA